MLHPVEPTEDLLKDDSGAANLQVIWPKPHPLVVKYRDQLTVLGVEISYFDKFYG